jgi:hypothetical protein
LKGAFLLVMVVIADACPASLPHMRAARNRNRNRAVAGVKFFMVSAETFSSRLNSCSQQFRIPPPRWYLSTPLLTLRILDLPEQRRYLQKKGKNYRLVLNQRHT